RKTFLNERKQNSPRELTKNLSTLSPSSILVVSNIFFHHRRSTPPPSPLLWLNHLSPHSSPSTSSSTSSSRPNWPKTLSHLRLGSDMMSCSAVPCLFSVYSAAVSVIKQMGLGWDWVFSLLRRRLGTDGRQWRGVEQRRRTLVVFITKYVPALKAAASIQEEFKLESSRQSFLCQDSPRNLYQAPDRNRRPGHCRISWLTGKLHSKLD
ncbi:unnamed protein product, partial [Thlaspi arvense]